MKKLLKGLYAAIPLKQPLFKVLRLLPFPRRIYQHLHFRGVINVRVPGGGSFRMRHHGYMIENELFWRGIKGGIEAAKSGHDVVMSPTSHLYLDYAQARGPGEPESIGGFVPLRQVYSYDPVPAELTPAEAKHSIEVILMR